MLVVQLLLVSLENADQANFLLYITEVKAQEAQVVRVVKCGALRFYVI